MKKLTTLLILTLQLLGAVISQEKYAVLITGEYAAKPEGFDSTGHNDEEKGPMDEFWNDTFLMWELLQTKGFSPENIFVLYADGIDYSIINQSYSDRYRPDDGITVTDYDATIESVELVFNGLTHGTLGFPKVTQDDFLFVFTHGFDAKKANINTLINRIDAKHIKTMFDTAFCQDKVLKLFTEMGMK
jgi:hypothetical protein